MLLFAPSESRELAAEIAAAAGTQLAPLEERSFEQGEFKLRPLLSVRERTVIVIQTLAHSLAVPTAQRLVRLLFLLAGLRDAGATRTVAVIPYLAYARKDRRTQARDPVYSRYVAELLEATGVSRLLALDVHNPAAFDNAYRIGSDHLSAAPMFATHFAGTRGSARLTVASPDVGGIKRVQLFRELLQLRLGRTIEQAFVEKRRALGEVSGGTVVGNVQGQQVLLLDDLCASGGTLRRAAASLHAAGAAAVHAIITHSPLREGLDALLADAQIDSVTTTDSIGVRLDPHPKLTVLPIAPLLGSALARLHTGLPLSPLLTDWPPTDRGGGAAG